MINKTLLSCAGLALTLTAFAQERKIERAALPPAVARTVDEVTRGSEIKGFATEREHGSRVYEIETIANGHTRDITIAEDGTLKEVEEEVGLDALPAGVRKGLETKAGGAKITKVESLTKNGRLVAYEAATLRGSRKGEVQVGPDGGALKHTE